MHNTEDKGWWVIEWAKKETLFVTQVCPKLGLNAVINPAKQRDRYAPDLMVNDSIADLKCQQTPFFKARVKYRFDPQFAITFNRKDYLRYKEFYPSIQVYFWVDWQDIEMTIGGAKYSVKPMAGVWRVPFANLMVSIEAGKAPLHEYQRRVGDTQGNARDSYLFDVRGFECLFQQGPK